MNSLGFRTTDDNGLSFELLVDGQPLGALIGARDTAIPFWIIEEELPYFPPTRPEDNPNLRIVCVCSCGEYGCGHTTCRVDREDNQVVFSEFDFDVSPEGRALRFTFARENYDAVVSEIAERAREYAQKMNSRDTSSEGN